jgi:hypothetical protein
MEAFLSAFETAKPRFSRKKGDLNLFHLLGLRTDEVSHSAFLAWLFDPTAAHGQGAGFLQAFLEAALPQIALQLPQNYRVQTELSRMASIIDIAAFRAGEFIVFVENKTVSPDTPGQHDREIQDLRRLGVTLNVPLARQYPVYLTPYGRRARGKHRESWHRVSYRDLSVAFSRMLQQVSDERTSLLLEDWLETTRRFGGAWRHTMNELSEASVLLGSNWPTVLSIRTALDDLEDELLALLFSMEAPLAQERWWHPGWEFRRYRKQIYIRNTEWIDGRGNWPLSMGVYDFNPDTVFGPKGAPVFYFRSRKTYDALGDVLREALRAGGHQVLEGHRHLVNRALQQCPHDRAAVEAYPTQVREQMVALFSEYADFAMRHEEVIRAHIKRES